LERKSGKGLAGISFPSLGSGNRLTGKIFLREFRVKIALKSIFVLQKPEFPSNYGNLFLENWPGRERDGNRYTGMGKKNWSFFLALILVIRYSPKVPFPAVTIGMKLIYINAESVGRNFALVSFSALN